MKLGVRKKYCQRLSAIAVAVMPVAGALTMFAAADARAGGFEIREESAEGMGDAFAGETAKAYGPNTAFYNPAGMTRLSGHSLAQTGSWIQPNVQFSGTNTGVPNQAGATSGSQGGQAVKPAGAGSTFGVYSVSPDLKIGLSVAVPFGMRSHYQADWVGRYQALATSITDYEFQPSIAYKLTDKLSIGGGPRLSLMTASMSNMVNQAALGLGDAKVTVKGDDWGVGYTLGTLYEFNEHTRVGLNYRSRIQYKMDGKIQADGLSSALGVGGSQNATAKLTLPDKVNVGIYHEVNDRLALVSDISWTHWSLFDTLNVAGDQGMSSNYRYKWKNTWFASVGADYRLDERWVVRTGFAFDQTPTKDATRDARLPDSNRYWLSAGASYFVTPDTSVHLGYAHIFMDAAKVNYSANKDSTIGSGTLSGTYGSSVNLVSVSLSKNF